MVNPKSARNNLDELDAVFESNSIRNSINSESDIISQIKLILNHDRNKVCIVVEGESDQKMFRHLLSENSTVFYSNASKTGVNNIVEFFGKNKRVVGIRDKDYSSKPINRQCFFCDYCCAEMMIISVDSCFDRLRCNYYEGNMNSEELRLYCLERLEKLSKIRMLNDLNEWNINFKGIKPSKYYQENIDAMNKAMIDDLNSMNKDNPIDAAKEKVYNEIPKCSKVEDYLLITNGHDFVCLFCKIATKEHGQNKIKEIEAVLRGTFGKNEFKTTALYKDLLKYQKANKITIVNE